MQLTPAYAKQQMKSIMFCVIYCTGIGKSWDTFTYSHVQSDLEIHYVKSAYNVSTDYNYYYIFLHMFFAMLHLQLNRKKYALTQSTNQDKYTAVFVCVVFGR